MASSQLSINNTEVLNFFEKYPSLNFEEMVIQMVRHAESIIKNLDTTQLNQNMALRLFENINKIQFELKGINENINKSQIEFYNQNIIKMIEFKKELSNDIQTIIGNTFCDKITLIQEFNNQIVDKTRNLLDDLLPRNNDKISLELNNNIKQFYTSVNNDINNILNSSINKTTLTEFVQNIDSKLSQTIMNTQTVFLNTINSTEYRINTQMNDIKNTTTDKIDEVKNLTSITQNSQTELQNNLIQLLKKMENSSMKGQISENIIENIFNNLFPSANISNVTGETGTGDLLLIRNNKPMILIENKNHSKNVITPEVNKFIGDCKRQNCSGLMLSQTSGITGKENYKIDIVDNNVLLYIHNVEYNSDKIKVAIDIIDNIKFNLDKLHINDDNIDKSNFIDNETITLINDEITIFFKNKDNLIKKVKNNMNNVIKDIEELNLPEMKKLINTIFLPKFKCNLCNNFIGDSLAALSAHNRTHTKKENKLTSDISPSNITTTALNTTNTPIDIENNSIVSNTTNKDIKTYVKNNSTKKK